MTKYTWTGNYPLKANNRDYAKGDEVDLSPELEAFLLPGSWGKHLKPIKKKTEVAKKEPKKSKPYHVSLETIETTEVKTND